MKIGVKSHGKRSSQDEVIWCCGPFDPLAKSKIPALSAAERPIISRELGTRRVMELALRQQGCSLSRLRIRTGITQHGSDQRRMVAAGAGNRLCLAP